ncbi:hypothetical protein [Aeromonas sp. FDAARGOS 1402]|nr:hypothetical protein [Aeromonas sp. FDAARGOS 1402]
MASGALAFIEAIADRRHRLFGIAAAPLILFIASLAMAMERVMRPR